MLRATSFGSQWVKGICRGVSINTVDHRAPSSLFQKVAFNCKMVGIKNIQSPKKKENVKGRTLHDILYVTKKGRHFMT